MAVKFDSNDKLSWELRGNEPVDIKNYLRMDIDLFNSLLELFNPEITKQNTILRGAVKSATYAHASRPT